MGFGDMHSGGGIDDRGGSGHALVKVEVLETPFRKLRGLLGRTDFDGEVMLAGCSDIHTFGMRRPLDVAFVDARGVVMAVYRRVPPRCRIRCPGARATFERFSSPGRWYRCGQEIAHNRFIVAGPNGDDLREEAPAIV